MHLRSSSDGDQVVREWEAQIGIHSVKYLGFITGNQRHTFKTRCQCSPWETTVNQTAAAFVSGLEVSQHLRQHHFVSSHPKKGRVVCSRATRVLYMYSERGSGAEARPPPSIPHPHISKPAGRFPNLFLLPPSPPPPPAPPPPACPLDLSEPLGPPKC